jgi:probable lipoprotein NlpC
VSHWSARYIGLPWVPGGRSFDGADCYGLATLVYREELGIELRSYDQFYVTAEEREEIAELIAGGTARGPWRDIAIEDAREFDGVVFRLAGFASHIGIVVSRGLMLHVSAGRPARMERFLTGHWRPAIASVLRHESRI